MSVNQWAPYLRLQEQYRACRIPELARAIEGAMDRELKAISAGSSRAGSIDTAMGNHRRRERRRLEIESKIAPLVLDQDDPWPEIDDALDLERRLGRLDGGARVVFLDFVAGHTYAELAIRSGRPMGTIKSQIHRARLKLAA